VFHDANQERCSMGNIRRSFFENGKKIGLFWKNFHYMPLEVTVGYKKINVLSIQDSVLHWVAF
jgi:hypothetical protein